MVGVTVVLGIVTPFEENHVYVLVTNESCFEQAHAKVVFCRQQVGTCTVQ